MTLSRLGASTSFAVVDLQRPFSNFRYVDQHFGGGTLLHALRRLFSLARRGGARALIVEDLTPAGAVEEEVTDLQQRFSDYAVAGLRRLTFWKTTLAKKTDLGGVSSSSLLGYAIVKGDTLPSCGIFGRWHIFESVFRKYPHIHNCVPGSSTFRVRCGDRFFRIPGTMYCQQNNLNKACAQVALRSLLTRAFTDDDVSYRRIHQVADRNVPGFDPSKGLNTAQIRAVLDDFGLAYSDLDYTTGTVTPDDLPYDRLLYSGVENRLGGLVGFEFAGSGAKGERHIIPFFGHTFNQDTWAPRAQSAYFRIGDHTRYISSLEWLSSFIGHDDNLGANFCVPRRFIEPAQVKYVVALRPQTVAYDGVMAEACAVDYLYSALSQISEPQPAYWLQQLAEHVAGQDVVLRALQLGREDYVKHLAASEDWQHHQEKGWLLEALGTWLPSELWVVEVSIPELFFANYRKLGEVVLDATVPVIPVPGQAPVFRLGRFPGLYLIDQGPSSELLRAPSDLKDHTPLFCGLRRR